MTAALATRPASGDAAMRALAVKIARGDAGAVRQAQMAGAPPARIIGAERAAANLRGYCDRALGEGATTAAVSSMLDGYAAGDLGLDDIRAGRVIPGSPRAVAPPAPTARAPAASAPTASPPAPASAAHYFASPEVRAQRDAALAALEAEQAERPKVASIMDSVHAVTGRGQPRTPSPEERAADQAIAALRGESAPVEPANSKAAPADPRAASIVADWRAATGREAPRAESRQPVGAAAPEQRDVDPKVASIMSSYRAAIGLEAPARQPVAAPATPPAQAVEPGHRVVAGMIVAAEPAPKVELAAGEVFPALDAGTQAEVATICSHYDQAIGRDPRPSFRGS